MAYLKRRYLFFLCIILLIVSRMVLWGIVIVSGDSMAPAYTDKQRLIAVKYSKISRFDVITILAPNQEEIYLKRVIGLPGETIEMKNDELFVNNGLIEEPFLFEYRLEWYKNELTSIYGDNSDHLQIAKAAQSFTEDFRITVPADEYFVMGDNRLISYDSRHKDVGTIKKSAIRNEVKLRIWPLNKLKLV